MSPVNTARGPIPAAALGLTLMHEHTVIGYRGWDVDGSVNHSGLAAMASLVSAQLGEVKNYGVSTIVDASPNALGRNVELNRLIAEQTGLNIICSTGTYMAPDAGRVQPGLADSLYDTFMQDITRGVHDTGIRAGAIKAATSLSQVSPAEEAALKAAARAQKETGVPIITHTEDGTMGPQQAQLLLSEGADPHKVVIGHMCGNADIDYQLAVLQQGVYVNFDRWGLDIIFPDAMRLATLIELLKRGFAGQIVLSHDHIAHWLEEQPELPEVARPLIANWTYTHIFKDIIPLLKKAGITDAQINMMLVENPRKIFE